MAANKRNNGLLAALALTLLLLGLALPPTEATIFILGETCLLGLDTALGVAAGPLRRMGVDEALEVVRDFCDDMVHFSVEGVVMDAVEPQLRQLVRFLGGGALNLRANLPDFVDLVNGLADSITEAQLSITDD